MRQEVATGIVRLVERRAAEGLQWLEVEFFGGEPLAHWKSLEYLSHSLSQLCDQNNIVFSAAITTNATLLYPSRLETLMTNRVRAYQITLDGPKTVHDLRRISKTGAGSFDTIWQRLLMLKAVQGDELEVTIRLHYDAATWRDFVTEASFLDELLHTFFSDVSRFKLHFNPIEDWGSAQDGIVHFKSTFDRRMALDALLRFCKQRGLKDEFLPQLAQQDFTGESGHQVCYAARANAFVIRADGKISKCTVALDSEKNVIGSISPDGLMAVDHELHSPWLRGLISGEPSALSCPAIGHIW
jgi:uncharacterized protein